MPRRRILTPPAVTDPTTAGDALSALPGIGYRVSGVGENPTQGTGVRFQASGDGKNPIPDTRHPIPDTQRPAPDTQHPTPHPGTLSIVSTPIGNPEDITLRALRILREVALIVAEDPRMTRKLLQHYSLSTEVVSFRPRRQSDPLEIPLASLRRGENIALVSDAGTPLICDPGSQLIHAALALGASVIPVPGAVAALSALVVSGLPAGRFTFDGFPPRARADRRAFFAALASETRTLLLYESAACLRATLDDLKAVLGPERPITVACDLTRPGETVYRGDLQRAGEHFASHKPRGEFSLVIAGALKTPRLSVESFPQNTE